MRTVLEIIGGFNLLVLLYAYYLKSHEHSKLVGGVYTLMQSYLPDNPMYKRLHKILYGK